MKQYLYWLTRWCIAALKKNKISSKFSFEVSTHTPPKLIFNSIREIWNKGCVDDVHFIVKIEMTVNNNILKKHIFMVDGSISCNIGDKAVCDNFKSYQRINCLLLQQKQQWSRLEK